MLPQTLIKGMHEGRLRNLLLLFFLALAAPTAVLIWQAYGQLKWEAFHQYRGRAEELTRRIDGDLIERINAAEARTFADYSFLVVSADSNFRQRSPLAEYPVRAALPGVIGYFQVDADGEFSTPLLPPGDADPASLGIPAEEYASRLSLARRIREVLTDNRLVRSRPLDARLRSAATSLPAGPAREIAMLAKMRKAPVDRLQEAERRTEIAPLALPEADQPADGNADYSQHVFDELARNTALTIGDEDLAGRDQAAAGLEQRVTSLGKVADLKLDPALEKKSAKIERAELERAQEPQAIQAAAPAAKRSKEQIVEEIVVSGSRPAASRAAPAGGQPISTFASEVDPYEFSLLDSGHLVLFRKVWRGGERYVQGLLIDRQAFFASALENRFRDTALPTVADLIVAYQDDVIQRLAASPQRRYGSAAQSLDGTLLYRSRLSAPLDSLELIFSVARLPPGPGAAVLGWVTLVLAVVFCGGFYLLYRLGLGQLRLARQQQDFVSAVSHELKTPLTSIRMYGEMLKEGWADADKRQDYYEFIHDESERLTRLISNVLQLASIARDERQLDLQPVAAGELMHQVQAKIGAQVERAGFELVLDCEPSAEQALLRVDEDCFAQIVINLVDNAIKFAKNADRKQIDIGSRLSGGRVVFSVRDYGAGVPRNQMKKIFRLFYRTESELTRETVGTGIGLAIVHQLALAMDGKVDVINRDPGAEFRVSLPTAAGVP